MEQQQQEQQQQQEEEDLHEVEEKKSNFINGCFVAPISGKYMKNRNPATNRVISYIPLSDAKDVEEAVVSAQRAFPLWSKKSAEQRAHVLDLIADAIEAQLDDLAVMESRDSGKPVSTARAVDIPRAVANFRFFAGAVRHDQVQATHMADALNYTIRKPVGVCGLITPWNLPLYLLSWKVAPALAMGNAVICKPSEVTPNTASALARIIANIPPELLPKGTFNLVHGLGREAGHPIVAHPSVHLVSFTGGTATGKIVAATASQLFKKCSLELGGKNSTVVFADCDFDKTVEGAYRAAFANQGQVCLAGSRIFVEHCIYERFVAALVAKAKAVDMGDPATCSFGSLSSKMHQEKVHSYMAIAESEGGVILCGGAPPSHLPPPFDQGAFFPPTIIANLAPTSRTSTEEIFGPVVTVHAFDDEEQMLKDVNCVRYGLAGSVWTSNLRRAHRVAQDIDSGMTWVNCWLKRDLRVPFGGVKESGLGREGGEHSLEFYSESKNICVSYT